MRAATSPAAKMCGCEVDRWSGPTAMNPAASTANPLARAHARRGAAERGDNGVGGFERYVARHDRPAYDPRIGMVHRDSLPGERPRHAALHGGGKAGEQPVLSRDQHHFGWRTGAVARLIVERERQLHPARAAACDHDAGQRRKRRQPIHKTANRAHIDQPRIISQQRRCPPFPASIDRRNVERDHIACGRGHPPRIGINPGAAIQHQLHPRPLRQRCQIDQPIIARVLPGDPARHHARIAQGRLRRQQHRARTVRQSTPDPVRQHRNMGMAAADQQHRLCHPRCPFLPASSSARFIAHRSSASKLCALSSA